LRGAPTIPKGKNNKEFVLYMVQTRGAPKKPGMAWR